MAAIELYINQQLCDVDNPENFSIYFKRQLINPSELGTKDAQRSYDITLPATATNNTILGYVNTEEANGKFVQFYDAMVAVGGLQIFEGQFKLSEITKNQYKGNLGVPKAKTIKDIFGDKNMNDIGEWKVDWSDSFPEFVTKQNKEEDPDFFFPWVLYGLMQKDNAPGDPNPMHRKTTIDKSTSIRPIDILPSIKCVEIIKKIFNGFKGTSQKKYNISGSAFSDERINRLFVSYRNPEDYTVITQNNPLDLTRHLPSNVKISDWIESFCKTFNLRLEQKNEYEFTLDTTRILNSNTATIIDFDQKADINKGRSNTDMGIPSVYELAYKTDTKEYGYIKDQYKEDGSGKYVTNSLGKEIKHTSDFSYTWMTKLENHNEIDTRKELYLPVITESDIWEKTDVSYGELLQKRYTDKSQRFWYKKNDTFGVRYSQGGKIEIGLVTTALQQEDDIRPLRLDYKNKPYSIMNTYFTVFVGNNTHFTTIECYLTPEQYSNIDTSLARFNGDLYYIAEVDGYDPMCRKKAKIKLIKKGV